MTSGSWNLRQILLLAGRFALGAIFLIAAYLKLKESWLIFAMSIDSYQLFPTWAVFFLARTLPWFELFLGLWLVSGYLLRWSAAVSGLLLFSFWLGMLRAYLKGFAIDCGCFGSGEAVSPLTLVRDGAMVAVAIALWKWGGRKTVREELEPVR